MFLEDELFLLLGVTSTYLLDKKLHIMKHQVETKE